MVTSDAAESRNEPTAICWRCAREIALDRQGRFHCHNTNPASRRPCRGSGRLPEES